MSAIGLLGKTERLLMLRYGILARLRKQFSLPDAVFEDMAAYLNLIDDPDRLDALSLHLDKAQTSADVLKFLAETARQPKKEMPPASPRRGAAARYDPRGRPNLYQSIVDEVSQMTVTQRSLGSLGRRLRQTELLIQMGCSILTHLDKDVVLDQIVSIAQNLLSADISMVILQDDAFQVLEYRVHGLEKRLDVFPHTMSFLLEPARTGRTLWVENLQALPLVEKMPVNHINVQRLVSVPLIIRGKAAGVLVVGQTTYGPLFNADDIKLLETFARQASVALENTYLHDEVMELAQLHERQRIAQDLHDSTVQLLFVMGMEAEALLSALPEESAMREKALRIRRLASRATADLRGAISALSHGPLRREAPLPALLQELVDEFEKISGIQVTLVTPADWPDLPTRASQSIYRIIREALANIQKHAQASAAVVSVALYPDVLKVSIQDNGVGFAVSQPEKADADLHFGMRSMQQLAQQAGGYLEVLNNEDGGALVRLTLPLKKDME